MSQTETNLLLVDAGFDYLTFTSNPKRDDYEQFNHVASAYLAGAEKSGLTVTETRSGRYEGWQAGETFYGKRADSAIWRTSGGLSRTVAQFARAHELRPNVTRADIQSTIEQPDGDTGELGRIFEQSSFRRVGSSPSQCKKHALFYIEGVLTGGTIGSRSSTGYLRCYRADIRHPDKFALPSLRYEFEVKAEKAAQLWSAYFDEVDDVALSCKYVGGAFAAKRVMQPICADYAPCKLPPIGRKSSDQRTVYWIQNSICKTIARLVKAGYLDEIAPHIIAALCPVPEVRELSSSLESEIQTVDWELIENGKNHYN